MGVALELIVVAAIIYFTVTQIFIPVAQGTRPFPMFGVRRELEEELEKLRTEAEEERLREAARREREAVEELRRKAAHQQEEKGHGNKVWPDDIRPGDGSSE